jgi:TolA-binding protein
MRSPRLPFLFCMLAAACGGTTKTGTTPGGDKGSADQASAGTDLTIALDVTKLQGIVFQPEALGRPPMTLVEDKKKQPLDKQRAAFKAATGPAKEIAAQIFATSLYQESKKQKDDAKQQALLEEGRKALDEGRAEVKGQAQDVTLRMLGTFALIAGDYTAGADVYGELVKRFPTGEKAMADKAWLALSQLRLGKNADALATLAGTKPEPAQPELDYVMAWAKWRGGDDAGAVAAITAAAQGWKSESTKPAMTRDLLILLARGGAPADAAVDTVAKFFGGKATVPVLYNLHNSYAFAGRWNDAIAVLEKITVTMPDNIAKNDLPKFRSLQAQYAVRALAADRVVGFEKQALEAYAACGDKCKPDELDDGYKSLRNLTVFFHTLYATSMDDRFFEPARQLYELYLGLPGRADADEMKKHADDLAAAKKSAKPGTGTHDKSIIGPLMLQHAQEVQACYEATLAADASVSGTLALTIDVDQTGKVVGATSNPPPGKAGLARVGACAIDAARTWILPARSIPGKTILDAKYELSPAGK